MDFNYIKSSLLLNSGKTAAIRKFTVGKYNEKVEGRKRFSNLGLLNLSVSSFHIDFFLIR